MNVYYLRLIEIPRREGSDSIFFSLLIFIGIEKYIDVYKIRYHKYLLRKVYYYFNFPKKILFEKSSILHESGTSLFI